MHLLYSPEPLRCLAGIQSEEVSAAHLDSKGEPLVLFLTPHLLHLHLSIFKYCLYLLSSRVLRPAAVAQ